MRQTVFSLSLLLCLCVASAASGQGFPFPPPGGNGGFNFSLEDTTTELGASFELVISVGDTDVVNQSGFNLNVDPADLFIEDWQPGAALTAYLNANGPIGCDDSNTGSDLSVFFFFNAPFDAAVYGTELARVQCIAVAQQEGTTTATILDTFGMAGATATVTFSGGTPIDPSQLPQPPVPPLPIPGPIGMAEFTIEDAAAQLGQALSVSVDATATDPVFFTAFTVTVDPTQLSLTGIEPGAGMQQYIADNGPVPCDVVVADGEAFVFMLFVVPLDTNVYGTNLLNITCDVVATTPGTTDITIVDELGQVGDTATITIADGNGNQFLRGDSNGDGSCNIADVVNALDYLFNGGAVMCMDATDVNDDGDVNIADPLALLTAMFDTTVPFDEECGSDTSPDALDCQSSGC